MRMWNVHPKLLCDLHLLEEHSYVHFLAWSLHDRRVINPEHIKKGFVEVHNILPRHTALAKEMKRRGIDDEMEFPLFRSYVAGEIDIWNNLFLLAKDCPACRIRIEESVTWFIEYGFAQGHKHRHLLNFIRDLKT